MAEHMHIHDVGHELALLVAYNRKDRVTQAAVEDSLLGLRGICNHTQLQPTVDNQPIAGEGVR